MELGPSEKAWPQTGSYLRSNVMTSKQQPPIAAGVRDWRVGAGLLLGYTIAMGGVNTNTMRTVFGKKKLTLFYYLAAVIIRN